MAAAVLESLAVPRAHVGASSALATRAAVAPVSAVVYGRKMRILPESRGLRIASRSMSSVSAVGVASRGIVRRGLVVCEAQDTAIQVLEVTKSSWQSLVMECNKPVLVEFWAPWCGPCRMINDVIGKLSKVYEGRLQFCKLNTDESPDIATEYGIRSIPTMIIFKNGEKKDAVIGAVPESTLVTYIEKFL